jgi:manganese transport protein
MNKGFRFPEAFIVAGVVVIASCFLVQIRLTALPLAALRLGGVSPSTRI